MPAKRLASMVLPEPGGPIISTLWPPAAATSSARLAVVCPRTSRKSGSRRRRAPWPLRDCETGVNSPGRVSKRDHFGQVPHAEHAHALDDGRFGGIVGGHDQVGDALLARADGDRKRAAHRPHGAIERQFADEEMLVGVRTAPIAPRMPMAIGRSKPAPSLRTLAGARLMVTRLLG